MLLIGPSGSGKSTIMNIAAGSKIECYKNEKNDWVIKADPDIAPIGHHKSETFLPNKIILSNGEVVYDCLGFNDTRGAIYDIAKSWILKQIGSHAKSIKICLLYTSIWAREIVLIMGLLMGIKLRDLIEMVYRLGITRQINVK